MISFYAEIVSYTCKIFGFVYFLPCLQLKIEKEASIWKEKQQRKEKGKGALCQLPAVIYVPNCGKEKEKGGSEEGEKKTF